MKDWKMMPEKIHCLKQFRWQGLHHPEATRANREVVLHGAVLMAQELSWKQPLRAPIRIK